MDTSPLPQFNAKDHEVLQIALKTLAGLEASKLDRDFSTERLAHIKDIALRLRNSPQAPVA